MSNLVSLGELLEGRLLRIPDYQRGYAWGASQLDDFWEDLFELGLERQHYTGMISLQKADTDQVELGDEWFIHSEPETECFYVVDGQQRLTTALMLVRVLLDRMDAEKLLDGSAVDAIRRKFLFETSGDRVAKTFRFCYERENPSAAWLKEVTFGTAPSAQNGIESRSTRKLQAGKAYLVEKVSALTDSQVGEVFGKLTKQLVFTEFVVADELNVHVTFETMNNRGKPLSTLELLKNRLIYLTTLPLAGESVVEDTGRVLRGMINTSWMHIYKFLAIDPERSLPDDVFLRNHWIMYFGQRSKRGWSYADFLLEDEFSVRSTRSAPTDVSLCTKGKIKDYVASLESAARAWSCMHFPVSTHASYLTKPVVSELARLQRLGYKNSAPLVLSALCALGRGTANDNEVVKLLNAVERFLFLALVVSIRRAHTGRSMFDYHARSIETQPGSVAAVAAAISGKTTQSFSAARFYVHIDDNYRRNKKGFYAWNGLKYFLFEYDLELRRKSKKDVSDVSWSGLKSHRKDNATLEHIYPQTEQGQWIKDFEYFSATEKFRLCHSLGNLVPLSKAKNSSALNHDFSRKKNNGKGVGYYCGSNSETEINLADEWRAEEIRDRGLRLLAFLESNWGVKLGGRTEKMRLLGLDFLEPDCSASTSAEGVLA